MGALTLTVAPTEVPDPILFKTSIFLHSQNAKTGFTETMEEDESQGNDDRVVVGRRTVSRGRRQGTWWLLTVPFHEFTPWLPPDAKYISGQLEDSETGYLHWQFVVCWRVKKSLVATKNILGTFAHCELLLSDAGRKYCHKVETRVAGTTFELGKLPFQHGVATDWDEVRANAISGAFTDIPSDVFVRCYNSIKRIRADNLQPVAILRTVHVYWGRTGSGKTRRAWDEAGLLAYPKDPRSKFWDGYNGQPNVIFDEFRGGIDIGHILRWTDRYPVNVEIKGSSCSLTAPNIWFTSNLHPRDWYPELDAMTIDALLRRLVITQFH